jgi:Flp pilus assembly CpaF family ATPase
MASASSAWSPTMSAPRFMPASPRVSAELPETGERFEGLLPPVVAARPSPSASPPSRCSRSTTMSPPGSCRGPGRDASRALPSGANILVAGGTSTGKTTLTNALLAEVAKTTDRVV